MARKIQVEIVGDARSLERAFGRASNAGGKFNRSMRKLAYGVGVGVGGAFVAVGLAIRRGMKEAIDAEKVMAQTRAVLASTGGAANVTAKHVEKLAGSLSRMSGVDDEAIQAAQNLLLTFTQIRNVKNGPRLFDMATKAVLDMDTAIESVDLQGAAMMVGKALNQMDVTAQGNVRGFMALRRVGVQVTPEMMKMAAAFIKAGQPMKAQLLLIKELNTEFGGSAKAAGNTLQGTLNKINNAIDELTGAFAEGLIPVIKKFSLWLNSKLADPAFMARMRELGILVGTKLYNAFLAISQWFETNWPAINSGIQTTVAIFRGLVGVVQKVIEISAVLWSGFLRGIGDILRALSKLPVIGGKVRGALEAVEGAQAAADARTPAGKRRAAAERKKKARVIRGASHLRGYPRQHGGPVMPNVMYRVGEGGPESVMFGSPGTVIPNGAGGIYIANAHFHGVHNVRQLANELNRYAKGGSSSTRGRLGGQRLALT